MLDKLKTIRNNNEEEGFTLIELMIVVVIIGILAAIAIPIFANQQKAAIESTVKSDLKNASLAVTAWQAKNNGQLPKTCSEAAQLLNYTKPTEGNEFRYGYSKLTNEYHIRISQISGDGGYQANGEPKNDARYYFVSYIGKVQDRVAFESSIAANGPSTNWSTNWDAKKWTYYTDRIGAATPECNLS